MKMLYPYINRFSVFSIIGALGFVVGLTMQFALVELLDMSFVGAFTIQLVFTIWLNYYLNRRFTWRSRRHGTRQAVQFFASRIATGAVAWTLNALILLVPGMPYMIASFAATVIVMALNFAVGEVVIFKHEVKPLPVVEATSSMQLSKAR